MANTHRHQNQTEHHQEDGSNNKRHSIFSPDYPVFDPLKQYGQAQNAKPHTKGGEPGWYQKVSKKHSSNSGEELKIFGEQYFSNYELSWLQFNWRVLEEARDDRNPLLERVKFIGIVCSNLDEFFQKRVGGLKRQRLAGVDDLSVDGKSPKEQLEAIREDVHRMIKTYRNCFFDDIFPALEQEGIQFKGYDQLNKAQQKVVDDYFEYQLYPILTPLVVDQSHPFPLISNKSLSFAVELFDPETREKLFARIKVPSNRPRWLTAEQSDRHWVLISIDDVIKKHMHRLFPGAEILSANIFRITRSADIERNEEEADDLLELIEEELRERRFADIVRMEIDENTPEHIINLLLTRMNVNHEEVFLMKGFIGLADAIELYDTNEYRHLKYQSWVPTLHPVFRHELDEETPSIFEIIRGGDFLVHHPYHSFETSVQRFIEESAEDKHVLAIKQTMYRTSSDSPLMHALMRAADAGKQVAVLVELKARFDEERNIVWAQKLEKAGVHVSYGLAGLKIHTKVTIVVRQEENRIRRYVHLGTGNYHPHTAQLYEDIGFFTCDEQIASDSTALFNFLTGFAPEQHYDRLHVAPKFMRKEFEKLIQFEIDEAKEQRPARIIAKMNSLEDPLIIQKLYEASEVGVPIDLIVRGVCRLKPGISGMSSNIRVHSIIGRFLEHSRLFYFQHGREDLYFIGSADWMHRNLDNRVESVVPIDNPRLKQYLQFVLNIYMRDNRQRWVLKGDGSYERMHPESEESSVIATHPVLINHVLSGEDPIPKSG